MRITSFKKPVGAKGNDGTNGVSWSRVNLSIGDSTCIYGGYKLVPSDGSADAFHCNAQPDPKFLFQALTQKTLKSKTKTFLNKFQLPCNSGTALSGYLQFNKLPGSSPNSSAVDITLEIDGAIYSFLINNTPQNYLRLELSDEFVEYNFSHTPANNFVTFAFFAENTLSNVTNELGPIFFKLT